MTPKSDKVIWEQEKLYSYISDPNVRARGAGRSVEREREPRAKSDKIAKGGFSRYHAAGSSRFTCDGVHTHTHKARVIILPFIF